MKSGVSLNHFYRTVWNQALGAMVAVAEISPTHVGSGTTSGTVLAARWPSDVLENFGLKTIAALVALAWVANVSVAYANPAGGVAVAGQASMATQGNKLTVTTQNAAGQSHSAINWQSFSIPKGNSTYFAQPNAASTVINRVVTNTPSQLFGTLGSNGSLLLVNQAGITVGAGAVVDTAGFTASALRMSDVDALTGRLKFGQAGSLGGVVSVNGNILARSGDVVLIGSGVDTGPDALIQSPNGATMLVAGSAVSISARGLEGIQMEVRAPSDAALNLGTLKGDAVGIFAGTLKHSGAIQATTAALEGGKVVLKATGDAYVQGAGKIDATGIHGGSVDVLGNRVAVADQAQIDVSGAHGGGTVRIGGDYQGKNAALPNAQYSFFGPEASIQANATGSGDGGKVIVWADRSTRAFGAISARGGVNGGDGGFVETSGKQWLDFRAKVNVGSTLGSGGILLLDPDLIYIVNGSAGGVAPNPMYFDDTGNVSTTQSNIYTDQIAGITAGTTLELNAKSEIKAIAGSFGGVTLPLNSSLVLRTRNDSTTLDGAAGIDLTTLDGGSNSAALDFTTQGTGTITMTTGYGAQAPQATSISVSKLTTQNQPVVLSATGKIVVNDALSTGAGNITLNAGGSISATAITTIGGAVTLNSTGDLAVNAITTRGADNSLNALAGGNAGAVSLTAGGSVQVSGSILAQGGTGGVNGLNSMSGGSGGTVTIHATGTAVGVASVLNHINAQGGTGGYGGGVNGAGGAINITTSHGLTLDSGMTTSADIAISSGGILEQHDSCGECGISYITNSFVSSGQPYKINLTGTSVKLWGVSSLGDVSIEATSGDIVSNSYLDATWGYAFGGAIFIDTGGGSLTMTAAGKIDTSSVDAPTYSGYGNLRTTSNANAGALTLTAGGAGGITAGDLNAYGIATSVNGNGGAVTLSAPAGAVNLMGTVQASGAPGTHVGNAGSVSVTASTGIYGINTPGYGGTVSTIDARNGTGGKINLSVASGTVKDLTLRAQASTDAAVTVKATNGDLAVGGLNVPDSPVSVQALLGAITGVGTATHITANNLGIDLQAAHGIGAAGAALIVHDVGTTAAPISFSNSSSGDVYLKTLDEALVARSGSNPGRAVSLEAAAAQYDYGQSIRVGALTAGTLSLVTDGPVSQSSAITVDALELSGGNVTLTDANNSIGMLAGTVGSLALASMADLTVGTVGGSTGINTGVNSSGNVSLSSAGNLTVNAPVSTTGYGGTVSLLADSGHACLSNSATCASVTFGGTGSLGTTSAWTQADIYYNPTAYDTPTDFTVAKGATTKFTAWMLVNDVGLEAAGVRGLQAMATNLAGNYVLGKDIDASATATWNSDLAATPTYAGFAPVGNATTAFTGNFDGGGACHQPSHHQPAKQRLPSADWLR